MKMRFHDAGFTLLEVLIAVLVLAIGLLGLAKLQTFGLQANHGAHLRTQATWLAYDITDRMRANRGAFLDASGNFIDPPAGSTAPKQCEWDGSTVTDCTPTEMAQFDLAEWRAKMAGELPGGSATVCLDSTPDDGTDADGSGAVDSSEYACDGTGSVYAVKIWWAERDEKTGVSVIKRFVTTFQP